MKHLGPLPRSVGRRAVARRLRLFGTGRKAGGARYRNSALSEIQEDCRTRRRRRAVADIFKKAGYDVSLLRRRQPRVEAQHRKFEDAAATPHRGGILCRPRHRDRWHDHVIPTDAKLAATAMRRTKRWSSPASSNRSTARTFGLVILDACRDNPFLATMKRQRQALRQVASGLGPVGDVGSETLVAYAAKQGPTAKTQGRPQPFTTAILHNLPGPGLDIRLAFGRVRDEVLKITSNRQEPYVYGSLGGSNVALVPAPEKAAPQMVDQDKMRADYELVMKV